MLALLEAALSFVIGTVALGDCAGGIARLRDGEEKPSGNVEVAALGELTVAGASGAAKTASALAGSSLPLSFARSLASAAAAARAAVCLAAVIAAAFEGPIKLCAVPAVDDNALWLLPCSLLRSDNPSSRDDEMVEEELGLLCSEADDCVCGGVEGAFSSCLVGIPLA